MSRKRKASISSFSFLDSDLEANNLNKPTVLPSSEVRGGDDGGGGRISKRKEILEFRRDARIWYLYLEEAEHKAKERADLWTTSLDSLLIFAGLFAGVVSTFVVDARKDLQVDSEQRLLGDILDAVRNMSIAQVVNIPMTSQAVGALWMLSLYLTLFSAIMGVLSKAWLAKYVPATTRREAEDAYARYIRDKHAEDWKLEDVITVVPLLIQLAPVLLLTGLIVQSFGDNKTIGLMLFGFCCSWLLVYLAMSIFSLSKPSSPFNTPLSDMILGFKEHIVSIHRWWTSYQFLPTDSDMDEDPPQDSRDVTTNKETYQVEEGTNKVLAAIMFKKLLKSPKLLHVDEAIAEIARPSFERHWVDHLCKKETPEILLDRLVHCATSRGVDQREERLCNHLLALARFVELYEERILRYQKQNSPRRKSPAQIYSHLDNALRKSLQPGTPLSSWNTLPDDLRPLLFSVRAQILCLPSYSSLAEDFDSDELLDRPWEMAAKDVPSAHMVHFMVAASRGVIQDKENLRTISACIISLRLAKATAFVTETGHGSEWANDIKPNVREEVDVMIWIYLSKLYETTVDGWEIMATKTAEGFKGEMSRVPALNRTFRTRDLEMLKHAVSQLEKSKWLSNLIYDSITFIANMVVYKDTPLPIRHDGLETLKKLAASDRDGKTRKWISENIVASVISGLSKEETQPRIRSIEFLESISQPPNGPFYSTIGLVIPNLIEAAFAGYATLSGPPAMKLARTLWSKGSPEMKRIFVTHFSSALESKELYRRLQMLEALSLLKEELLFADSVSLNVIFKKVVDVAIHDSESFVRTSAQDVLRQLSEEDRLLTKLKLDANTWLDGAAENTSRPDSGALRSALYVVQIFIKQLKNSPPALEKLVEFGSIKSVHGDEIRFMSLQLVWEICKSQELETKMLQAIIATISSARELIQSETVPHILVFWAFIFCDMIGTHGALDDVLPAEPGRITFPDSMISVILETLVRCDEQDQGLVASIIEMLKSEKIIAKRYDEAFSTTLVGKLTAVGANKEWPLRYKLNWVELLAGAWQRPGLQKAIGEDLAAYANYIKHQTEGMIRTVDMSDETSPTNEWKTELETHYSGSTLLPPLRRLLQSFDRANRIMWVNIVAIIAERFPQEISPIMILQIAIHDPDEEIRRRCFQALLSLVQQPGSPASIKQAIIDQTTRFLQDSSRHVRLNLARILGLMGNYLELSSEILDKLKKMAVADRDEDVRSETVHSLSLLSGEQTGSFCYLTTTPKGFTTGIKDSSSKVRQAWVNFAISRIGNCEPSWLHEVITAVLGVGYHNSEVQADAVGLFRQLLKDAELQNSAALGLEKAVLKALSSEPDRALSAIGMLDKITRRESAGTNVCKGHQIWMDIVLVLGTAHKGGEEASAATAILVDVVLRNKSVTEANEFIPTLVDVDLHGADSLQTILPPVLVSALRPEAHRGIRVAATRLCAHLIGFSQGDDNESDYAKILGRKNDEQIISLLARISIEEDDSGTRAAALRCLKSAFWNYRFRTYIKTSLSTLIQTSLKTPGTRSNTIDMLHGLSTSDNIKEIASPFIPQLIQIFLADWDDEKLQHVVEDIIFKHLKTFTSETVLDRHVLTSILEMLKRELVGGKEVVLRLLETLKIPDHTAVSIAHAIAPMLHNSSSFARATAIEILFRLYVGDRYPRSIETVISDVVILATEDGADRIRASAIRLLSTLSASSSPIAVNPVLEQIAPSVSRFMALLQIDVLRPSVVKLLSIMSADVMVRQTISLKIINLALGAENRALVQHVELLARLITDGRFKDEPFDYVMLFLASPLVSRPQLAPYRLQILAGLWYRYRSSAFPADKVPGKTDKLYDLVEWYTLALFGPHAREHEVTIWHARSKPWLDELEAKPTLQSSVANRPHKRKSLDPKAK